MDDRAQNKVDPFRVGQPQPSRNVSSWGFLEGSWRVPGGILAPLVSQVAGMMDVIPADSKTKSPEICGHRCKPWHFATMVDMPLKRRRDNGTSMARM